MQILRIFKKTNFLMLIKTRFKGLFLIKNKKFKDKRGYFKKILKEKDIK